MSDYLAPDYSDYDEDDDALNEYPEEDDDLEIERILDEQDSLNKELDKVIELDDEKEKRKEETVVSSNPFTSQSNSNPWQGSQQKAPWEKNNNNNSGSSWGGGSSNPWGTGGSAWQGNSAWSGQQQKSNTPPPPVLTVGSGNKRAVVIDVLDSLYESYESSGRPNILPRGIFDLKPKFDVWDRVASFNPQRLYIIFPAAELIPSLGSDRKALQITLDYISQSVSTYLRIPRDSCVVLQQMRQFLPKKTSLRYAVGDWKNKDEMVYIGTHSGRWGLSSRDIEAAREIGISYIDLYNLLDGKYDYE